VGGIATLRWTATDNVGVTSVDLLLSRAGAGGPFAPIASGVANTGSFAWTVTGPATSNAILKVVARDAASNQAEDVSNAAFTISAPSAVVNAGITAFALGRVTPNPTHGAARFGIEVPAAAPVRVEVLDLQGRVVATLVDRVLEAGRHSLIWGGEGAPARAPVGVYLVRMTAPAYAATRRLVYLR
jgi:hypothetical protein